MGTSKSRFGRLEGKLKLLSLYLKKIICLVSELVAIGYIEENPTMLKLTSPLMDMKEHSKPRYHNLTGSDQS